MSLHTHPTQSAQTRIMIYVNTLRHESAQVRTPRRKSHTSYLHRPCIITEKPNDKIEISTFLLYHKSPLKAQPIEHSTHIRLKTTRANLTPHAHAGPKGHTYAYTPTPTQHVLECEAIGKATSHKLYNPPPQRYYLLWNIRHRRPLPLILGGPSVRSSDAASFVFVWQVDGIGGCYS